MYVDYPTTATLKEQLHPGYTPTPGWIMDAEAHPMVHLATDKEVSSSDSNHTACHNHSHILNACCHRALLCSKEKTCRQCRGHIVTLQQSMCLQFLWCVLHNKAL
jgi:hypothetical protein